MGLFNRGTKKNSGGGKNHLPADLRDENRKFKVILDTIDDGVILIDNEQTIQLFNPAAGAISGWKPDEATGINVHNAVMLVNNKGEVCADAENPLKQVFQTAQTVRSNELFVRDRQKKLIPVTISVSPLLDAEKQVTAAVAVLSNVSKERLEEQKRADFISTASHEMRTPVAAIEGYLALALNDKVATIDSRAREYLEKAHISTQHLGKLFQDLLTSAKAEDGRLTSHPAVIELGDFLEQLSGDLRLVAEKKGLAMEFRSSANSVINATKTEGGERIIRPLYFIYADPDRLREVITNLFDNAVKYTAEGKVSIGVTGNDQVVQCYVRDTGPGIPADDLPHLFQKFYRVDNSATRTVGGTGLGLFISRKIVELYNGRIWVESKMGEGSTFYINLPRLTDHQAQEMKSAANFLPLEDQAVKPVSTSVEA